MDFKQRAETAFHEVAVDLEGLSHWLYENPEIAMEEHRSSARLAEYLEGLGFDTEYPAYGIDTCFAARSGSGGRRSSSVPSTTPCPRWGMPAATT